MNDKNLKTKYLSLIKVLGIIVCILLGLFIFYYKQVGKLTL